MPREDTAKVSPAGIGVDRRVLARSRACTYQALSLMYTEPVNERTLALLRSWTALGNQLPSGIFQETIKRGLRKIEERLDQAGEEGSAELLDMLAEAFTSLFRGLSAFRCPPPPYESVYVDGGLLYGPSTDRVAARYREFGLKVQYNEPPDHIALELDFMRFLCEREAESRQSEKGGCNFIKEEGAFLREHLAMWVPALCENVRKFDATGVYSGLADVTEGWIGCDREIIDGLASF